MARPALKPVPISINPEKLVTVLFFVLLGCEIFFVLGDMFMNVEEWTKHRPMRRFFNITREDGIASWFAVTQTWMMGLTAGLIYWVSRVRGAARWQRIGWMVITIFMLYMSMDDGSKFHERVGSSVKTMLGGEESAESIFPSYTWQLVFLPIFGSVGLYMLWFLNRELSTARDKLYIVAAIGLMVLAVAADFFEGLEMDDPRNLHGWIKQAGDFSTYQVRHYSKSLEEFMEMLAMTTFWVVFLRHLFYLTPGLHFRWRD